MKRLARQRRGITMTEAVFYSSLTAVLISLTAQWFHVLFDVASKNKQQHREHTALKHLAWNFRDDVWAATDFTLEASGTKLTLTTADGTETTYTTTAGWIQKYVGDAKVPSRQENWSELKHLQFAFDDTQTPNRISLNVYRPSLKSLPKQTAEVSPAPAELAKSAELTEPAELTESSKPVFQISSGPRALNFSAPEATP